jgi:hypothetical protein
VPAAIANAVYDAIGVRFTSLPMSAERVLLALREKAAGEDAGGPRSRPVSPATEEDHRHA